MNSQDDKNLAILCMTLLGVASLFTFDAAALNVVTHIIAGMAGIVTGKALDNSK